ncbi:hypothetical protein [Corallococcus carmarthensis]|uniref:hypothetical protein n=1 Tax=Corallococcus carmarthensis TaxID=2316728 RepID=UPI00148D5BED|nr:hypothetical protein [Corallococcus carmarthensis]NOK18723.1 hypothetical protein [Corallococcus carmarthensis]
MMLQGATRRKLVVEVVAIILVGAGIGWLIGQSVTPVLQTVLTSVLTIVAALLTAAMGLDAKADSGPTEPSAQATKKVRAFQVSAVPLALLLVALCLGSAASVAVRTRAVLGVGVEEEITRWSAVGMDRQEVVRRLFEARVPDTSSGELPPMLGRSPKEVVGEWMALGLNQEEVARVLFQRAYGAEQAHSAPAPQPADQSVLFAGPGVSECARLKQAGPARLQEAMQGSPNRFIRALAQSAKPDTLESLVELLCEK